MEQSSVGDLCAGDRPGPTSGSPINVPSCAVMRIRPSAGFQASHSVTWRPFSTALRTRAPWVTGSVLTVDGGLTAL